MRALATLGIAALLAVAGCGDGDEDGSSDQAGGPLCPKGDPSGLETGVLVGKPVDEAEEIGAEHGCIVRVVREDGKPLAVTSDLRPDRANVEVVDREITRIDGVY